VDGLGKIPRVGVVLLNWNGGIDTIPCIASLMRGGVKPWRIVVVDNASTDSSPDDIARAYPDVQLIRNRTNIGFAAGNNLGMRALLDAGAEFVWVLNNDTEVAPDCLERLLDALDRDPEIGGISAKILFADPPDCIWYAGGTWNPRTMQSGHRGQHEIDRGQYDIAIDTPFLSGCCMLMRASALLRVGFFAERFFIYMEDTDWCLRAARLGVRLRYEPRARIIHKVSAAMKRNTLGASGGRFSPRFIYLTTRNQLWIIRHHARGTRQRAVAMAHLAPSILRTCAVTAALGRWRKTAALFRGVVDGLFTASPLNT
jgi:GT2 family glycosyltransferase